MRAKTALWMIGISNLAFGVHVLLWKLRFTPQVQVGIDPFAGALTIWFLLFCILTVVEVVAIVRGYIKDGWKGTAAATVLLVLQISVMYFQYWMVRGA
jgi:hypothetical protein